MSVQSLHKHKWRHGSSTTVLVLSWQITHFFLSSCSCRRVSRLSAGGPLQLSSEGNFRSGLWVLELGSGRFIGSSTWLASSGAFSGTFRSTWGSGFGSGCLTSLSATSILAGTIIWLRCQANRRHTFLSSPQRQCRALRRHCRIGTALM